MNDWRRYLTAKTYGFLAVMVMAAAPQGCAPRPPYRAPAPPPPRTDALPPATRAPLPLPPESAKKSLPQEAKIREQDLKTTGKATAPAPRVPETREAPPHDTARPVPPAPEPPLPDDSSLLAKITSSTPPQRAASLRLTEEAKRLLDARDYPKALNRLETSLAIDSGNAYGYFYIAKAHFLMGRYKESLNFLDVAESRLSAEPFWLAEVHALRGENFRALDMPERAEASYVKALTINSGNRTATEALSRQPRESSPAQR